MENEILNIYIKYLYGDKINKLYNTYAREIEFPLNLKINTNAKTIMDFNDEYFKKFELTLLNNSILYALENNEDIFLGFIKDNFDNLKKVIDGDLLFRIKITEFAIKNISSKLDNNLNFNKHLNNNTLGSYKELFNKISNIYTSYDSITNLYKKLLYDFIKNNIDDIPDSELFLDDFLNSNKYDKQFMFSSNGIINETNILFYKSVLVKMILGDNYILSEVYLYENDIDEYLSEFDDDYDEEDDEYYVDTCKDILDYLDICLDNNKFGLPMNEDLRYEMYSRFFEFNDDFFDKSLDIDTVESNKEMKLKLKRINPLYIFDKYDFNN